MKLCYASVSSYLFAGDNAPGSPFQLEIPGVSGGVGGIIPLVDSSLLRIALGRPALVGIERGRGQLQTVAPACHVVCKSAITLLRLNLVVYSCLWKTHRTATERHLPYGITQYYPTEVNAPRLNPSQTGRYSIYLRRSDGKIG